MNRRLRDERGIALFLVLWILMLLSVIVGEFCHAMRTELNIVRNFKEEAQAYYIARAGVTIGINELLRLQVRPRPIVSAPGGTEEAPENPWRINQAMPDFLYGGGFFRIRMTDEGGKVNLNRAGPGLLKAMLWGFDLSEEEKAVIVDAIQDWRDRDGFHRLNGAEEDYYQSLAEPYAPKNGDFSSPAELLLVRGITPEIYYGGLKEMVTVFPGTPKTPASSDEEQAGAAAPFDYNRLNVNAAPVALLRSLPGMSDETAAAVIEFRKEAEFRNRAELMTVLGPEAYGAASPYLALQRSQVYALTVTGFASEGRTGDPDAETSLQRGVRAVVALDAGGEKPYRVLSWLDNLGDAG